MHQTFILRKRSILQSGKKKTLAHNWQYQINIILLPPGLKPIKDDWLNYNSTPVQLANSFSSAAIENQKEEPNLKPDQDLVTPSYPDDRDPVDLCTILDTGSQSESRRWFGNLNSFHPSPPPTGSLIQTFADRFPAVIRMTPAFFLITINSYTCKTVGSFSPCSCMIVICSAFFFLMW